MLPPEILDIIRSYKGYTLTELFYMKIPCTPVTRKRGGYRWIDMLLNDRIYFTYYLELDFHCPEIDKWVDLIWDNFEWDDEEDDSVWSLEGEERAWDFLKNNSTKK